MISLIPPVLIGVATGAADAGARALQDLPVSLGATATIAIFASGICLYISREFAKRDKTLEDAKSTLIERHQQLEIRLERIEQKLEDLPCKGNAGSHTCAQ